MTKASITLAIIALAAAAIAAPRECPTISVECPSGEGEIVFAAKVTSENPDCKLTYQWSITRGEIKSGQGTAKIILKADRDGSGLGASVEVLGLPANCANKASCYITHF
ncbi:MAG: hypothetical protein ACMG6H_06195 [Acidobacteriota bacterium]